MNVGTLFISTNWKGNGANSYPYLLEQRTSSGDRLIKYLQPKEAAKFLTTGLACRGTLNEADYSRLTKTTSRRL
jgi:hypothetical protein